MKPTRITSAILIIIAGLTGAYLIIVKKPYSQIVLVKEQEFGVESQGKKLNEKPFDFIGQGVGGVGDEKVIKKTINGGDEKIKKENVLTFKNRENIRSANLTELITENIKTGMSLTASENGEVSAEDSAKIEKTAEALVKDIIANPDVSIFNFDENIDEKNLKISADNSPSAQVNYFLKMREIGEKYLGDPRDVLTAIKATFEKGDNSQLKNIIESYSLAVEEAMRLEVPLSWVDFHKKAVAYVRNSSIVYDALVGFEDDPIKAYLANEAGPTLMAQAGELQILFKKNLERLDSEF